MRQRQVASGVVRAIVTAGLAWALWSEDPRRAASGIVLVLVADRWCDEQKSPVVLNAGAVAMSGGTVTVLGNAIGIQELSDGDGRER